MGSNIISGSAKAVILTTGNRTYLGSMAKSLNIYQDKSSFERNINSISSLLIKFMVVMVPVIFRIRMGDPSLITLTQDLVFCMSVECAAERYIGK